MAVFGVRLGCETSVHGAIVGFLGCCGGGAGLGWNQCLAPHSLIHSCSLPHSLTKSLAHSLPPHSLTNSTRELANSPTHSQTYEAHAQHTHTCIFVVFFFFFFFFFFLSFALFVLLSSPTPSSSSISIDSFNQRNVLLEALLSEALSALCECCGFVGVVCVSASCER